MKRRLSSPTADSDQKSQSPEVPCTRRCRIPWIEMRMRRAQWLPPGPDSTEALTRWELRNAQSLVGHDLVTDAEMMVRLRAHLHRQIRVITHFSGCDCPREAMVRGLQGLCSHLGWGSSLLHDNVRFESTTDSGAVQTRVLVQLSQSGGSHCCHFGDFLDRLPPIGKKYVIAARPQPSTSKADAKEAFRTLHAWAKANREWLFPHNATSICSVHGRQCAVLPSWPKSSFADQCEDRPLHISSQGPTVIRGGCLRACVLQCYRGSSLTFMP